jgi:hypothetical protein
MTTKRDRAAAAAFFNDQPEWDLTIAHWIETGEKRYGMGTVRPNVLALADAFAAHAAGEVEEVGIQLVALQARLRLADACAGALRDLADAQNGPPLERYAAEWTATMKSSYAALWAYEAVPGDEGSRGMV